MRRIFVLLLLWGCGHVLWADAYDPPAGYYAAATGSGATLKGQLNDIVDGQNSVSYDALRSILQITDADPNQAGHMILVYDRVSLNVAAINPGGPIPGWDNAATWNREHTWPLSRGVGATSAPDGTDLHQVRPSTTSVNSDRGNQNFGGAFGRPFGNVNDGGTQYWYPGDLDAGMIARAEFYMAVRYDGVDANTVNLELAPGNPADNGSLLGNLNRLLEWHYAAPPDFFERRRHQIIYDDYQQNRNPFIDRPEYVWSVFVGQNNNSQISLAGSTIGPDGSSSRTVDFGRILVGGPIPSPQGLTLSKNGLDGTYFDVRTTGLATSSITGPRNAFRMNTVDSRSLMAGLNTSSAVAGLKSGTITIDNLDITTAGGAGRGANDANDVVTLGLTVLDHATPSFDAVTSIASLNHDFGSVPQGSSDPMFWFTIANLQGTAGYTSDLEFDLLSAAGSTAAFSTNLAGSVGSLSLDAGSSQAFFATLDTVALGSFAVNYLLTFSDENLPGAVSRQLMLTLTGQVAPASLPGDFTGDGNYTCDDIDQLVAAISVGSMSTTFDLTGDGQVNLADRDAWLALAGARNLPSGNAYRLGDASLDGVVDGSDFGLWNSNKFTSQAAWCRGDFNADGSVDGSDFGVWNANKFTSSDDGSLVPEPLGSPLLGLAGIWLLSSTLRKK